MKQPSQKVKLLFVAAVATFSLTTAFTLLSAQNEVTAPPGMVMIPAACFQMGCVPGDSDCKKDEKPRHEVCLDKYLIEKYEVTNAKYAKCVRAGACTKPHEKSSKTHRKYYGNSEYDDYPVIAVDWNQATAYCKWTGKRLPTEAEWEYAARGGLSGKKYVWGDENPATMINKPANVADESGNSKWSYLRIFPGYDDGYADESPVGRLTANGYGLYDIAGNVWEWVADWYDEDYYSRSSKKNPTGASSGTARVIRGGAWFNGPRDVRVSNRFRNKPTFHYYDVGFRCISDIWMVELRHAKATGKLAAKLNAKNIADVIRRNLSSINYCYERELAKNPNLQGKVKVVLKIEPNGNVSRCNVESTTLNNSSVETCILNVIKRFRFPMSVDGMSVSYPFVFNPD
jgi:formylglycine-generating enzyme required for sulfatase activity